MSVEDRYQLLAIDAVRVKFGITYSLYTLLKMEAAGEFPKRIRLSARRHVWRASELRAWVDARAAESTTASIPSLKEMMS